MSGARKHAAVGGGLAPSHCVAKRLFGCLSVSPAVGAHGFVFMGKTRPSARENNNSRLLFVKCCSACAATLAPPTPHKRCRRSRCLRSEGVSEIGGGVCPLGRVLVRAPFAWHVLTKSASGHSGRARSWAPSFPSEDHFLYLRSVFLRFIYSI